MVWQPSDGFALRPEVSFSTTSIDSASTGLRDTTSLGVGLSGLFYVARWESLSTYVSPRFVYNRVTTGPSALAAQTNTYSLIGSFGSQYALNRRFGVFGEVGVGYSRVEQQLEISSTSFNSPIKSKSWNTRTGIGVMLYF
jgi:opacity protein-like surface antigen